MVVIMLKTCLILMIKRIPFSYLSLFPTHYCFIKNRKNKGITAFYKTLDQRKDIFSALKNPSHFFNDFLTVKFGDSKGIE